MTNQEKWTNITLSLAALFQAAKLVRDIARTGEMDSAAFEVSINSILKINSESVLDIYDSVQGLQLGLTEITRLLTQKNKKNDADVIRYILSLIYLEKKFSKAPELRKTLLRRMGQAQSQAAHFSPTHELVIETLATAFLQTLGQFHYRIQIVGNVNFLKQADIVAKIRALLLAGIRAAVLWRQMGGNKWQLLLLRKKIVGTANQLLRQA